MDNSQSTLLFQKLTKRRTSLKLLFYGALRWRTIGGDREGLARDNPASCVSCGQLHFQSVATDSFWELLSKATQQNSGGKPSEVPELHCLSTPCGEGKRGEVSNKQQTLAFIPLSQYTLCPGLALVLHLLGFHSMCSGGNQGLPGITQEIETSPLTDFVFSTSDAAEASEASSPGHILIHGGFCFHSVGDLTKQTLSKTIDDYRISVQIPSCSLILCSLGMMHYFP